MYFNILCRWKTLHLSKAHMLSIILSAILKRYSFHHWGWFWGYVPIFFFLLRHDLVRKVLFLLLVIYPFQKRCTRDFRRDFVNASVDLYASSLSSTAVFWINLFSHSADPWEMYWLGAKSSCVNTGVITNVIIKCRGFLGFSETLEIILSVLISQVKELTPLTVKCLPRVTEAVNDRDRTGTQARCLLTQGSFWYHSLILTMEQEFYLIF